MARLSPFVPFDLVLAFQAWLWPFEPVFGLSDTLYNLTICEKAVICVQPSNCQQKGSTWFTREFAETVLFHRVGRSTLRLTFLLYDLSVSRLLIYCKAVK